MIERPDADALIENLRRAQDGLIITWERSGKINVMLIAPNRKEDKSRILKTIDNVFEIALKEIKESLTDS